jgi:RimJ/RimL family protein N-acetyltransferase
MIDYSLVRLFDTSSEFVANHITSLSQDDRYLRFGYTPSDEQIHKYVSNSMKTVNSRTHADFWFGIKLDKEIVATIHIAIRDDVAEFAFSTDKNHRGKKLGQLLFARGYQLATEFSISKIYLVFLTQNAAMRHISKKFGLAVMTHGSDAESSVEISYPVPLSKISSIKLSIIDKSILKGIMNE